MSGRLEGQVAIVTGAAQGIGSGTAMRLAAEGAQVVCGDLHPNVEKTWGEIRAKHPQNQGYATIVDVTSGEQVNTMIEQAVERLERLDIIFNNAAILQPMMHIIDTPDEVFDRYIAVNLRGVFNGCRAAGRVMKEQRGGCIINMGSWIGKVGIANLAVYCATKAAVIRLTESLAVELAPYGVRANSICPGNIMTDMHRQAVRDEAELYGITFEEMDQRVKRTIPLGYQGTPEDIASAVVYLASSDGAYVTGQALNINGGVIFH
jgi:NAD(P)-dependent dehydrogenase (short-subunit alcohol dehydrogenase family)